MSRQPIAGSVEMRAPAKVNLFLEVHGRRADGYHDLESIFQAVSLYDDLKVSISSGSGIHLRCNITRLASPDNLASLAASAFLKSAGLQAAVEIDLFKRIPLEAGLGGGSSDAAAVLVALNALTGGGMDCEGLRELGATLGSDVPFFIEGGTALVKGRGETVAPVETGVTLHFVIFYPGFGLSTAAVYKNLTLPLTADLKSAKLLGAALSQGNHEKVQECLFNRLEKTAFALEERLCLARDAMRDCLGGTTVLLSGSGTSLFSAFGSRDSAMEGYNALEAMGAGEVFLAESIRGDGCAAGPKGDSRGDFRR